MTELSTELVKLIPEEVITQHETYREAEKTLEILDHKACDFFEISETNFAKGADYLKSVKSAIKCIDSHRLKLTKPLDESKKLIKKKFDEITNKLKDLNTGVNEKFLEYTEEQERIAKEEADKLNKDIGVEVMEPIPQKTFKTEESTTTIRKVLKAEVREDKESIHDFLFAIIEGKMPLSAVKIINSEIVKALKQSGFEMEEAKKYPYLRISEDKSITSR